MTTQRRTPRGYTSFVETTADTDMYAAPKPKDYKDPYRTNPDLEATRERWNNLYCDSLVPPLAPRFAINPIWPALWVIVIVGLCFIAAVG
jgi:hypothetical protein